MYLAEFDDAADVLVHATDPTSALEALALEGVTGRIRQLREVPPGLVLGQVRWASDEDEEDNPGNAACEGVAVEPLEAFADWLERIGQAAPRDAETTPELVQAPESST